MSPHRERNNSPEKYIVHNDNLNLDNRHHNQFTKNRNEKTLSRLVSYLMKIRLKISAIYNTFDKITPKEPLTDRCIVYLA